MEAFDQVISHAKTVLIISSRPLDFDSLGSGLVLKKYLESLDKKVTLIFPKKLREDEKNFYSILPYFNEIVDQDTREVLKKKNFDVLVMVDGSNLIQFYNEDLKGEVPDLSVYDRRIHIDHHLGHPEELGTLTIRDPKLSSTAEVIFQQILPKDFIDKNIATLIYAAIIGDTGNFRWNFYPSTLEAAGFLLSKGAQPIPLLNRYFGNKTKEYFNMLDLVIKKSEYFDEIKTILLFLPVEKIKAQNLNESELESVKLAFQEDFVKEIYGYDRGVVLIEKKPGQIHISARGNTLNNKINLPEMFLEIGGNGGGHFNATALTLEGDFEKVKKLLIETIARWQRKVLS